MRLLGQLHAGTAVVKSVVKSDLCSSDVSSLGHRSRSWSEAPSWLLIASHRIQSCPSQPLQASLGHFRSRLLISSGAILQCSNPRKSHILEHAMPDNIPQASDRRAKGCQQPAPKTCRAVGHTGPKLRTGHGGTAQLCHLPGNFASWSTPMTLNSSYEAGPT